MARKKTEEIITEVKPESMDFSQIMEQSYIDYAISVIKERALPDVRDGLKPVQRRTLYDMLMLGVNYDKPYRKSARIVGDTMGRFHPHGDSSIYGALINMGQEWKMNYCLSDIHGNKGSIDGDGAAAMRYTEARLSKMGQLMLEGIHKEVVPYIDTYDATDMEPTVFPCKYPQLFLNGADGIAVGMKSMIPPHNLAELIDSTIAYIKKPNITTKALMQYLQGPDYPTGGIIVNQKDLLNMYETGVGKVVMRSKLHVEDAAYGKKNIIITEIPYTSSGNKTALIESIVTLMKDRKLDELSEVRDESSEDIRIVLEVKKGVDIDNLLNKLYKKTKLQNSQSYCFLVVNGVQPSVISFKEYLEIFVQFQEEITTKQYQLSLKKALSRLEIVEGLLKAMDLVDVIIETIRFSKNIATAKKCLTFGNTENIQFKTKKAQQIASKFNFTEAQAQVILEMRLQRLNNLELNALVKERNELVKSITSYEKLLASKTLLHKEIIKYLTSIKKSFEMPRKTEIQQVDLSAIVVKEKEIAEEEVQVLIDRFGYVKVVDLVSVQRSSEDTIRTFRHVLTTLNTDKLAVFTDKGNLYQLKLSDIPKGKIKDKGQPIDVLCGFKEKEYPILIRPMNEVVKGKVLFVFDDGYVKYVPGTEYVTRQKATVSTKLYNNNIVDILFVDFQTKLEVETDSKKYVFDLLEEETHKKSVKGSKWFKKKDSERIKSCKLKEN